MENLVRTGKNPSTTICPRKSFIDIKLSQGFLEYFLCDLLNSTKHFGWRRGWDLPWLDYFGNIVPWCVWPHSDWSPWNNQSTCERSARWHRRPGEQNEGKEVLGSWWRIFILCGRYLTFKTFLTFIHLVYKRLFFKEPWKVLYGSWTNTAWFHLV